MRTPAKSGSNASDSIFPKRNALEDAVLIITLLIAFGAVSLLSAAITAGDIAIVGYNSANPDEFRIAFLNGANAGDVVNFTDNGWQSSGSFRTGEGVLTYTVQSGGIAAGATVNWLNLQSIAGTGWNSNNPSNFAFNATGDSLIAYTGTLASPALVYAFQQGTGWDANATSASTSAEPTSTNGGPLVSRVTTNAFGGANGYYSGAMTSGTKTLLQVAIANATNWTTSSSNIASTNWAGSFIIGTTASIYWDSNGTTAGAGGSGTWDATTNNTFKSAAADSGISYFRWVNSTAGNDHTAVFGGTAGTVSVAAGGVTASGLQFTTDGYTVQNNTITLAGTMPGIDVGTGVTATVSSVVAGSNGLTKTGGGPLRMLGNNVYSGPTVVTAGSFLLNGDNSAATGDVSVSATGTLGGTGTVGGATSVSGTLAPGDPSTNGGVGTTTFKRATVFTPGSKLVFTLVTPASSDKIVNTDNTRALTLDAAFRTQLDVSAYAASANIGDVFDLIDWAGTVIPNGFDPNLDIDLIGGPLRNGYTFNTSSFLSNGTLTVELVPEPSRVLLLAAGCTGMLLRRRRSKIL